MSPRSTVALLLALALGFGALTGCSAGQGKGKARPSGEERPLRDESAHTLMV